MVNPELFKHEIPKFDTNTSYAAQLFWSHQARMCMDGVWEGGTWMPPNMFWFINHWHITVKKAGRAVITLPHYRDLDWMRSAMFMEARGFSGFENDTQVTCDEAFKHMEYVYWDKKNSKFVGTNEKNKYRGSQYRKAKYVRAYDRILGLYMHPEKNYGRALYNNVFYNMMDVGTRGSGKTAFAASNIGWIWTFGGYHYYEDMVRDSKMGVTPRAEALVSSATPNGATQLVNNIKTGFNHLSGRVEKHGSVEPPPFFQKYSGTLNLKKSGSSEIVAEYTTKKGTETVTKGSGSQIHLRTFASDETSANGLRFQLGVVDEAGFVRKLTKVLGNVEACVKSPEGIFGSWLLTGTAGKTDPELVENFRNVLENPEAWRVKVFEEDHCFFVPAQYQHSRFRNKYGVVDFDAATAYEESERDRIKQKKRDGGDALLMHRVSYPLNFEDMFITSTNSLLPATEIEAQYDRAWASRDSEQAGQLGKLIDMPNGDVRFVEDKENNLSDAPYPISKGRKHPGALRIWEHPDIPNPGTTTAGYYIGVDPYEKDSAPESNSLGSTFVIKAFNPPIIGHEGETVSAGGGDYIVAEYTGRPDTLRDYADNLFRILKYYGAPALIEDSNLSIRRLIEKSGGSRYIAKTPRWLIKTTTRFNPVISSYGVKMTQGSKSVFVRMLSEWLLKERPDGSRNIHHVWSLNLLKEMRAYNRTGNFDRVIALMIAISGGLDEPEMKHEQKEEKDPFFTRDLFVNGTHQTGIWSAT